jgi:ankyrin repeat protein
MEQNEMNKIRSFCTLVGAIMFGDVETVEKTLDEGENVDVRFIDLDYKGEPIKDSPVFAATDTPLLVAVKSSARANIIQLLLDRGADVTVKDENGKTPLEIAKERELPGVVRILEAR